MHESKKSRQPYGFIHADVSGFYDNIDREQLMNSLRRRIDMPEVLKLVYRAITTPVVPRNSRRTQRFHYYVAKGIPQGLAISNILAAIYMSQFDRHMQAASQHYMRYVDDIVILSPQGYVFRTLEKLRFELAKLGLKLNEEKTKIGKVGKDSFDFLGYRMKPDGVISIRDVSLHRKLTSIAARISSADHRKKEFLRIHKGVIDENIYKAVLIEDINEEITGAIGNRKRYGWLFYFSQMNDMALLHRSDRIVTKLCTRCGTFSHRRPKAIKSFVTAFREIHKLASGIPTSYIPDYDEWNTSEKTAFFQNRGQLLKGKKYTEGEIESLMYQRLRYLERDVRDIS